MKTKILYCLMIVGMISCSKKSGENPWYHPDEPFPGGEPEVSETALYNGIELPSVWPPRTYVISSSAPMDCPYLDAGHPDVVPIDIGRQLFVDDFLVAETDLERVFHQAVKYAGNPILQAETALEAPAGAFAGAGPKDGGIWWDPDDQVFKMWYEAGWLNKMAYATSVDGLSWNRPDLKDGLNEIVSLSDLKPNSCSVVLDYDADPSVRYKLFFRQPNASEPDMMGYVMTSADGLAWGHRTRTGICGDRSTMFYNPFRKKWVFSIRSDAKLGSTQYGRARYYLECDDPLQGASWTKADPVFWCRADNRDKADPVLGISPELYNLDAVAYESILVGVHQILVDANDVAMNAGRPKVTDLELGFSRDGFHWDRPCRDAFISSSRTAGTWDRGYVQCVGGLFAVMGDELWFWYIGFAGVDNRPGHSASLHSNMATGVATLRRDGFASMRGKGSLTTVPVVFSGRYLFVNIDSPSAPFTAEILDEAGNVVPGFEKERCKPIQGDSTLAFVQWEGGSDLSALAGKTVRIRFHLDGGELYSFWVSPSANGQSNGYVAGGGPGYTGPVDTQGKLAYGKTKPIYRL